MAKFQIKDMFKKTQFLKKTFLLANINIKKMPKIPFLTFNKIKILFLKQKLN